MPSHPTDVILGLVPRTQKRWRAKHAKHAKHAKCVGYSRSYSPIASIMGPRDKPEDDGCCYGAAV